MIFVLEQKRRLLFIVHFFIIVALTWEFPWKNLFNLDPFVTASEFCEWADVDFDVCIPHRNYQFKLHSSLSFLAFYVASIVYTSHFSPLHQQSKFSRSKFKDRETSKRWKRVLDLLNLHMLIKEDSVSPRRKFFLATFGKLLIKFQEM